MAKKVTRASHRREDRRPKPPTRTTPVARPKQVFPAAPEAVEDDDQAFPVRDEPHESPASVRPPQRPRPATRGVRPGLASGPGDEVARGRGAPPRIRPPAPIIVDYSYVRRDLLRIAVLACTMLVVLVALTFVYK